MIGLEKVVKGPELNPDQREKLYTIKEQNGYYDITLFCGTEKGCIDYWESQKNIILEFLRDYSETNDYLRSLKYRKVESVRELESLFEQTKQINRLKVLPNTWLLKVAELEPISKDEYEKYLNTIKSQLEPLNHESAGITYLMDTQKFQVGYSSNRYSIHVPARVRDYLNLGPGTVVEVTIKKPSKKTILERENYY